LFVLIIILNKNEKFKFMFFRKNGLIVFESIKYLSMTLFIHIIHNKTIESIEGIVFEKRSC